LRAKDTVGGAAMAPARVYRPRLISTIDLLQSTKIAAFCTKNADFGRLLPALPEYARLAI
jgi:hypothetical protein